MILFLILIFSLFGCSFSGFNFTIFHTGTIRGNWLPVRRGSPCSCCGPSIFFDFYFIMLNYFFSDLPRVNTIPGQCEGGMYQLAAFLERERNLLDAANISHITIDAGNAIQGMIASIDELM